MSKSITLGTVPGELKATVTMEFRPLAAPSTPAEQYNLDALNMRFQAVADSIAKSLESQSIEELERRLS